MKIKLIIYENLLKKSYVRGHFIIRNGQKYWVKPYENRRTKKIEQNKITKKFKKTPTSSYKFKENSEDYEYNKNSKGFINFYNEEINSNNFILEFALNTAEEIHGFDEGEKANFNVILNDCKYIINKLGYMDNNISYLFKLSTSTQEPIEPKNIKKIKEIYKQAKKIYLRVNDSDIKKHIYSILEKTKI